MFRSDYYKILGIKPEQLKNKSEDEIHDLITAQYRRKALIYHPDKKGGSKEAFQELLEAYRVLKDKRRRQDYDETLRLQEGINVAGLNYPAETSDPKARLFQALKPLKDIQKEFNAFVKDRVGDGFAKENGYASELTTDPQTGAQMLKLTFPNKEVADQFIQQMLAKGMIKEMERIPQHKPSAYDHEEERRSFPSPFKTGIPRLTPPGTQ